MYPDVSWDCMVLDLFAAASPKSQELFREVIRRGLKAMYESGDVPADLARKVKMHRHFHGMPVQMPSAMPMFYPPFQGIPPAAMPPGVGPMLDYEPAETAETPRRPESRSEQRQVEPAVAVPRIEASSAPPVEEPEPAPEPGSTAAILGMMGRRAIKRTEGA